MDIKVIEQNYKEFDDYTIEKLALEEVADLRPEAIELLKNEIRRRNLSDSLLDSIQAQTREFSEIDIEKYCNAIRNHPCPKCNGRTQKLNASFFGEAMSFIVFSSYNKKVRIACPDCLDKLHKQSNLKSAFLGWWGIPWGPIYTIKSFIFNHQMKKLNALNVPSSTLISIALEHRGIIEASSRNDEMITELITSINNSN